MAETRAGGSLSPSTAHARTKKQPSHVQENGSDVTAAISQKDAVCVCVCGAEGRLGLWTKRAITPSTQLCFVEMRHNGGEIAPAYLLFSVLSPGWNTPQLS